MYIVILIFYRKLYHVRSVTQGDVYRADAKDIPRIFQVETFFLYIYCLLFWFLVLYNLHVFRRYIALSYIVMFIY